MAVQQNKKSPSKRGMHRAHDFLTNPPLAVEPTRLFAGEIVPTLPLVPLHHVTAPTSEEAPSLQLDVATT